MWWSPSEIISHVWKMKEEGNGIEEGHGAKTGAERGITKQLCGDNGPIGVGYEDETGLGVLVEDSSDLGAHIVCCESGMGHREGDR